MPVKYSSLCLSLCLFLLGAYPTAAQVELTTYHNEEYGYSISYPKGYTVEERDWPTNKFPDQQRVRFQGGSVAFLVTASRSEKLRRVSNERLTTMMMENEKGLKGALRRAPGDQVKVKSVEAIDVNGKSALFVKGEEIGKKCSIFDGYF